MIPINLTQNLAAFYLSKHKKSTAIYMLVLLAFILGIAALPLINIAITFQSRGQIRPVSESNTIVASVSGKIKELNITENETVHKGATLLVLNTDKIEAQIALQQTKLTATQAFIADLTGLTLRKSNCQVTSLVYKKELQQYRKQIQGLTIKRNYHQQELKRFKQLFEKGVVAAIEHQQKIYDAKSSAAEIINLKNNQLSKWQNQLLQYTQDTINLSSQIAQLNEDKKQYVIKAPIAGTIKNYSGIKAGNFVVPNQTIAEISPNGNLIVECLVSPKDIGFLKEKMTVNFQVDAYNYNQWGLAKGVVTEIFNDISMVNNEPVFRVRCKLITPHLQLKNGFVGQLKKGMTLTGRFKVTERTLWQLLYDKMDDWLNPTQLSKVTP
jgi:multidrug resistance efflux pump